jgi:hypothetical protein
MKMKRTNVINAVKASRAGYFASPSFWVCEATDENYRILRANNVQFTQNTFVAASGERCTRFEF